jgi:hypothetical protein
MTEQRDYREPLTDEEAEQMERGFKRLLQTPPKPHGKSPTAPPKVKKRGEPKARPSRPGKRSGRPISS